MISTFINHELKAFWRSKNTGKGIAVLVVLALLILYLFATIVYIGLFLDKELLIFFPKDDVVGSFYGVLMLYFLMDLLLRVKLQDLPTLRAQPYLHLPIKRNTIVSYLCFMGMASVFNLWPIVLFLPFIVKIIGPQYGFLASFTLVTSIVGFTIFNNYLALFIKRKSNVNGWIFLGVAAFLIMLLLGDFKLHLYSICNASYFCFNYLLSQPLLVSIPLLLAIGMYYLNFVYLRNNLYMDELNAHKISEPKSSSEYPFLGRFGAAGDLTANEIKLILRNKRPRSALIASLFFLLYGLIHYTNSRYGQGWNIFAGMFMTGIFVINYGQYMHSWQAAHFDGILASRISFNDFIKSKYILFTLASTAALILTTPYVYFGWNILLLNLIMYLWNIGVNATIVLFFANRNAKRIDLSKSGSLNWQGAGGTQLLLSLPLFLTPYVLYFPFAMIGQESIGLGVIVGVAIFTILTRTFWIKKLEVDFIQRRYTILEGFRNK
ncbi:MAG: DUF5687 family protein [Bacteroidia bacterium]